MARSSTLRANRHSHPATPPNPAAGEPGVAVADQAPVGVGDRLVLRLPQPVDELLPARDERGPVDPAAAGRRDGKGLAAAGR